MTVYDALKKSEVILIEGSKKSGKLTFILFEIAKQKRKKVLILSTYPKYIFKKRLNAISFIKDRDLQEVLKNVEYLNLKENWEDLKNQFGFEFLLEDIKRIIKTHSPEVLIFHRLDLLFTISDMDYVKPFMEELIEIKPKQLYITVVPNKDNASIIEIIENFSDINLVIKKSDRTVSIKHSIFPIQYEACKFNYDGEKLSLNYQEEALSNVSIKKIVVASNNNSLIKLNRYIFDKEIFKLHIAKDTSEVISKLLENPDIVIYTSSKIDLNICKMREKIDSKILYIVEKEYVRTQDKMIALQKGCSEVMSINFSVEEYILEIEKLLQLYFYSSIFTKFPNYKIASSFENFCNIVNSFYLEKIVFSVVKFKSDESIDTISKKVRLKDIIYKEKETFFIALINVRKENLSPIIKKLNLNKYEVIECFEWQKRGFCR